MNPEYDLSFDARLKRLLKEWDAELYVGADVRSIYNPEIFVTLHAIHDDDGRIIRDCQTFGLGPIVRG